MKRHFISTAISGVTAAILFTAASISIAGGGSPPTLPYPGAGPDSGDGVVEGKISFEKEVFVVANKDSSNPGGSADQAKCPGGGIREDMKDMRVTFWTKTSGLAEVHFCGVVDMFGGPRKLGLRALVDSEPGNDVLCQPGDIEWDRDSTGDYEGDGPICFTWLCEIENPKGCGYKGRKPCPTEHEIKMQCGTSSPPSSSFDGAQFNERYLRVRYNKGSSHHRDRDDDDDD